MSQTTAAFLKHISLLYLYFNNVNGLSEFIKEEKWVKNRTTVNRHRCIQWFLSPLCTDSELLPRLFPVEVLPDCVCLSGGLWVHPPGGVPQKQQRHLSWQHHRPLPSYTHGQVQEALQEGSELLHSRGYLLIRVDIYLKSIQEQQQTSRSGLDT